jgi:hypothetical protein
MIFTANAMVRRQYRQEGPEVSPHHANRFWISLKKGKAVLGRGAHEDI